MAISRNLDLEKKAVDTYTKSRGALPSQKDETQWGAVYKMAYPTGELPEELKNTTGASAYAAGFRTPSPVTPNAPTVAPTVPGGRPGLESLQGGINEAKAGVEKYANPNQFLTTLQDALKLKIDAKNQNIGQSDLFGKAGLTGYSNLGQSLADTGRNLSMQREDLLNMVNALGGQYKDQAQTALFAYNAAVDSYDREYQRVADLEKTAQAQKYQIDLINKQAQISKELANMKTAETLYSSGLASSMEEGLQMAQQSQSSLSSPSNARTDRNNNPTAMTTDVAKTLGLVEGVDYQQGDPFQSGTSTLYTAKFIGDPFETTIKALDTAASNPGKQAFYTQGGGQRWTHTALSDQQWLGMSQDQKMATVQKMYASETPASQRGLGGSASQQFIGPKMESQSVDFSPYKNALSTLRANKNFGDDDRKALTAVVNKAISTGDTTQAKEAILSAAMSALPGDMQNKAIGRVVAIDELANIQSALDEYIAAGGNTNLLAGSVEKIAQRVGATSNPKLASLGNQIQAAIVAYRSAVSGAAFTESEKSQYESMFPSTGNVPSLNKALTSSLITTFQRNQSSTLGSIIGKDNYKAIFESTPQGMGAEVVTPSGTADILSKYGIMGEEQGKSKSSLPAFLTPRNPLPAVGEIFSGLTSGDGGKAVDGVLKYFGVTK